MKFAGDKTDVTALVKYAQDLEAQIERLRRDCAELYQVIGTMAEHCPDPSDPAIVKALDNASDAAGGAPRRHDDLLPFVLPDREPAGKHEHRG